MTTEDFITALEKGLGVARITDSEIVYKGKHRLFTLVVDDKGYVHLYRDTFYGKKTRGKPTRVDLILSNTRVAEMASKIKEIADIPVYKQTIFDIRRFFGIRK